MKLCDMGSMWEGRSWEKRTAFGRDSFMDGMLEDVDWWPGPSTRVLINCASMEG